MLFNTELECDSAYSNTVGTVIGFDKGNLTIVPDRGWKKGEHLTFHIGLKRWNFVIREWDE